jgi:hypothetical protein
MAGYSGYSKSNNALVAESEGKMPLTEATKMLAEIAHVTQKKAREIFKNVGPCEWHHTSKMYNRTDYYDIAGALYYIACTPIIEAMKNGICVDHFPEDDVINVEFEAFNSCDR